LTETKITVAAMQIALKNVLAGVQALAPTKQDQLLTSIADQNRSFSLAFRTSNFINDRLYLVKHIMTVEGGGE
jgi:hypothetical protein